MRPRLSFANAQSERLWKAVPWAVKWFCMFLVVFCASTIYANDRGYRDVLTGMQFVLVKGACFEMGAVSKDITQRPVHTVCVKDFYMGKYEVTQREWELVMENNPSFFKRGGDYPVEHVTFDEVRGFIVKLNRATEKQYRLPTEAEWEYAARSGGRKDKYPGTNKDSELRKYAWFQDNANHTTHPVGQKLPNELGLYDMAGNVWEWVSDWYDAEYYGVSPKDNPQGPAHSQQRVLRGGSWSSHKDYLLASNRGRAGSVARYSGICGFRLALSLE